MKTKTGSYFRFPVLVLALAMALGAPGGGASAQQADPSILDLVVKAEGWILAEDVQSYFPESLFEYINGAAESYLSYDFRELLVAQFEKEGTEATMTLEVYDMGMAINAFGIFSAERYPENRAASIGDAAYVESEALNFLDGKYYVKLLGFGLGTGTEAALKAFASGVSARIKGAGGIPELFGAMPVAGIIPQSEKFVKKNFLGYEFLSDGYVASYRVEGQEIECFVIEAGSDEEARTMENRLLDALSRDGQVPEKLTFGTHVRNRYAQHLFLDRTGPYLFGVVRVPDGLEEAGGRFLKELRASLSRRGRGA